MPRSDSLTFRAFLIGVIAPILLVGGFYLYTAIRRWTAPQPKFDILFTNQYLDVSAPLQVINQRLTVNKAKSAGRPIPQSLLRYNVSKDSVSTVSLKEAMNYMLLPDNLSPDGYKLTIGRGYVSIMDEIFGIGRRSHFQIAGHGIIITLEEPNRNTSRFLGWILKEK